MKKQNGITIIALIITIILMLMLATISVNVAINGGLFEKASDAVSSTEIANEKDTVVKANILAKSKNKIVTVDDVQKALNSITGPNVTTAMDDGDTIVVKFNDSNRYYEIENSGNVELYESIFDENPGNIKVGIKGEVLTGNEDAPFEIWCIEDLVELSNGYAQNYKYAGAYVKLCRNLNFKSELSYTNSKTMEYGDINEDGLEEPLIEEMQKGKGFPMIKLSGVGGGKDGIFNGQGYIISNIYMNSTGSLSFLAGCKKVENLEITGFIKSENDMAGGILSHSSQTIEINSCINRATIIGVQAGGIVAYQYVGTLQINNCFNYGKIEATAYGGGILGHNMSGKTYIYNCGNYGMISAKEGVEASTVKSIGGICGNTGMGSGGGDKGVIANCYNLGIVKDAKCVGGILGEQSVGTILIENVINLENIRNGTITYGSLANAWNPTEVDFRNGYYLLDTSQYGFMKSNGRRCCSVR